MGCVGVCFDRTSVRALLTTCMAELRGGCGSMSNWQGVCPKLLIWDSTAWDETDRGKRDDKRREMLLLWLKTCSTLKRSQSCWSQTPAEMLKLRFPQKRDNKNLTDQILLHTSSPDVVLSKTDKVLYNMKAEDKSYQIEEGKKCGHRCTPYVFLRSAYKQTRTPIHHTHIHRQTHTHTRQDRRVFLGCLGGVNEEVWTINVMWTQLLDIITRLTVRSTAAGDRTPLPTCGDAQTSLNVLVPLGFSII